MVILLLFDIFIILCVLFIFICFFFQAEDGIRDLVRSRGLGDVYKRQGFDIIYALQDETFDKELKLHSIPAAIGKKKALMLSLIHI